MSDTIVVTISDGPESDVIYVTETAVSPNPVVQVVVSDPGGPQGLPGIDGIDGVDGETGQQGPPGPSGGAASTLVYQQSVATTVWLINHNLGYRPNVTCFQSDDTEIEGDEHHVNENIMTITYAMLVSGYAVLS